MLHYANSYSIEMNTKLFRPCLWGIDQIVGYLTNSGNLRVYSGIIRSRHLKGSESDKNRKG